LFLPELSLVNFNEIVIGSAALRDLVLTFDQKNKRVRISR